MAVMRSAAPAGVKGLSPMWSISMVKFFDNALPIGPAAAEVNLLPAAVYPKITKRLKKKKKTISKNFYQTHLIPEDFASSLKKDTKMECNLPQAHSRTR